MTSDLAMLLLGGGLRVSGGSSLAERIETWRASAEAVTLAGFAHASFADDNNFNAGGSATGITVVFRGLAVQTWQTRQYGYIDGFWAYVKVIGDPLNVKIKSFYPNLSTNQYDMIAESELLTFPGTGLQYLALASPLLIEPGCVPGIWLGPGAASINRPALSIKTSAAPDTQYALSDVTTSNAFAASGNFIPDLEFVGAPPYVAVTGDSIMSGQVVYSSFYDAGVPGPRTAYTSEPANALRTVIGGDLLDYQNHANAGENMSWVASTGAVSAVASGAKNIIVHCGINDIQQAREWSAVEADLDTIAALIGAGQTLLIDEILPDTNFTDGQSATTREWNGYLATWCAANGARLIRCHDAMGQLRISTGQLDDLTTEYDKGDGVHLSPAGVTALATVIKSYL